MTHARCLPHLSLPWNGVVNLERVQASGIERERNKKSAYLPPHALCACEEQGANVMGPYVHDWAGFANGWWPIAEIEQESGFGIRDKRFRRL